MDRRPLLLILFCLGVLVVNTFATEPALDATDERAIALALRAIKMTPHDLSFSKTNVESELVLQKARAFLQQPLALPEHGHSVLTTLQVAASLRDLVNLAVDQAELRPQPKPVTASQISNDEREERVRASVNWALQQIGDPASAVNFRTLDAPAIDPSALTELPAPLARAVETISVAALKAQLLLKEAFPGDKQLALDAYTLETLNLEKDAAELKSWEQMGINTGSTRALIEQSEKLELQDNDLVTPLLIASDRFDRDALVRATRVLAEAVDTTIANLRTNTFTEEFQVETDTPLGKIIVGGVGRNVYTNEAFLIIDLGGDDMYENSAGGANGLVGRPVSIVIDLAGNDQFISRRSFSQGSGVFGIGILAALGSNCTFQAKHLSQGAGFFGCGLLMTGPGKQTFEADTFCQGAGMFGAGILWQRGGDTTYKAAQMAQGFGGTGGVGLLLDDSGNDSYLAGGKYPCDWLAGHYFSLSQGFGYGMRPFAGGGVGILCDLKGDDHYVADVYGQGASYWYSVGLLLDAEGNDTYDAYQYCQGAGIHLSSGALIDWAGNDIYTAGHICQGAAHDYSVGMLIDRAGNDKYVGDTTAQGSAINNSFALLLDRAGDDSYTGTDLKQSQAAGHNGDKREYGSIALLHDLGGKDTYSQGQTNNAVWLKPWYGAGLDFEEPTNVVAALLRSGESFISTSGASQKRLYTIAPVDPHHPVEQLLRRAISDKPDAGKAWEELKQRGVEVLPYLLTRLDSPNVLVRAKTEELVDYLSTNSIPGLIEGIDKAKNDEVARICCYFLARFDEKARTAIPHVLPLLNRDKTRTTAFYTLGHLRAWEAFGSAMKALGSERELVRLRAAQALGRIGDKRAIPKLIAALDDEMWDVRYAAQDALVALGKPSIGRLRTAFAKASPRARPHIIEALGKLRDRRALALAKAEYRKDDPLVRAAVEKQLVEQLQSRP